MGWKVFEFVFDVDFFFFFFFNNSLVERRDEEKNPRERNEHFGQQKHSSCSFPC